MLGRSSERERSFDPGGFGDPGDKDMDEDKQNKPAASCEPGNAGVGPIRACVRDTLDAYFEQLNGTPCAGLYKMVLREVEVPLLQVVMQECGGNQTRAAELLGINRGTLRKKLQHYGLEEE